MTFEWLKIMMEVRKTQSDWLPKMLEEHERIHKDLSEVLKEG